MTLGKWLVDTGHCHVGKNRTIMEENTNAMYTHELKNVNIEILTKTP